MEAYKLFEECLDQKIEYSAKAYITKKDVVRSKVAAHFLDLDLVFLDEDLKDDKPTPKAIADPSLPTQLRSPFCSIFYSFLLYIPSIYFRANLIFVSGL